MLVTEYVRNCNCNYERIHLEQRPEEQKYQYCILNRGGIRYLLPGSLRYINGEAYLYYDISSTQNIGQLFEQNPIGRAWMRDFLWGIRQMHNELDRFLLEEQSIIWQPGQVFQDLEKNDFFFLYVPYYKEDNGLAELMEFLTEHIDYEDNVLVEFVYGAYEQIKTIGQEYLRKQIHEDWLALERKEKNSLQKPQENEMVPETIAEKTVVMEEEASKLPRPVLRKGLHLFGENRRKKQREKEDYRERMRQRIAGMPSYAVCEETVYEEKETVRSDVEEVILEETLGEEEYGKTIYIEETRGKEEPALYKTDGELAARLDKLPFVIGKKKENVNFVINDYSVSRVHARITQEEGIYYIEDLNSTNGTFKNGLRMQPYEKRKLEQEDELKFGKTEYVYR